MPKLTAEQKIDKANYRNVSFGDHIVFCDFDWEFDEKATNPKNKTPGMMLRLANENNCYLPFTVESEAEAILDGVAQREIDFIKTTLATLEANYDNGGVYVYADYDKVEYLT